MDAVGRQQANQDETRKRQHPTQHNTPYPCSATAARKASFDRALLARSFVTRMGAALARPLRSKPGSAGLLASVRVAVRKPRVQGMRLFVVGSDVNRRVGRHVGLNAAKPGPTPN